MAWNLYESWMKSMAKRIKGNKQVLRVEWIIPPINLLYVQWNLCKKEQQANIFAILLCKNAWNKWIYWSVVTMMYPYNKDARWIKFS